MAAPTLVISFHGGKGSAINTLESLPGLTDILPGAPPMQELRGFTLGPGSDSNHLYVVNAYKLLSLIFQFTSAGGGQYSSGKIFACNGLSHPFDAAFGPDGNLYVSNQDSNQITCYQGPAGSNPGAPLGTFGPAFQALRGITWAGSSLYAADEKAGVLGYNSNGTANGVTIGVKDPVHLFYDGTRYIYIGSGSGDSIWVWDTNTNAPISPNPAEIIGSQKPAIKGTAGMALPGDGNLYVASRKGNAILQYPIDVSQNPPTVSNGKTLVEKLKDNPEFVAALGVGVYG